MNRRSILGLSVVTAFGLAVLSEHAVSQPKSLKDQLVGTWTPVSWEQDVPNAPKLQRFGSPPKGIHVFDANGHFVIMFARSDLPKLSSNNIANPTPEEAKTLITGLIAYHGTYTVDEAAKIISLKIEATSFPNQLGIEQKRTITSLTPTELKYVNTTVVGNAGQIYVALKRAN
jgi:hypothetical protein